MNTKLHNCSIWLGGLGLDLTSSFIGSLDSESPQCVQVTWLFRYASSILDHISLLPGACLIPDLWVFPEMHTLGLLFFSPSALNSTTTPTTHDSTNYSCPHTLAHTVPFNEPLLIQILFLVLSEIQSSYLWLIVIYLLWVFGLQHGYHVFCG